MKALVESLSDQIENWGMVWFGLIFLGSIFNEFSLFNALRLFIKILKRVYNARSGSKQVLIEQI